MRWWGYVEIFFTALAKSEGYIDSKREFYITHCKPIVDQMSDSTQECQSLVFCLSDVQRVPLPDSVASFKDFGQCQGLLLPGQVGHTTAVQRFHAELASQEEFHSYTVSSAPGKALYCK